MSQLGNYGITWDAALEAVRFIVPSAGAGGRLRDAVNVHDTASINIFIVWENSERVSPTLKVNRSTNLIGIKRIRQ